MAPMRTVVQSALRLSRQTFVEARHRAGSSAATERREECLMLKRLASIMATVTFVTGVFAAGTAFGQQTLGFTINPTEGRPGDTVTGQVNPADVAANCVTDVAAFQARFTDLLNGPFVGGNTVGDLPQTWFPDPNNIVYENTNQLGYVLTLLVVLGISADIGGAAGTALPQTFVMTFANFDQTPIGELGHFDPVTGAGSVTVPDVTPGVFPVAATCVGPVFDLNVLRAGIEASGAFLTGINAQFGPDGPFSPEFIQFMRDFLGPNAPADDFELLIAFVNQIGPTLLQPIVAPDALGVQLFTVLPPPLNHFQCYGVRNERFSSVDVTLVDRFGSLLASVRRATDICAPSDKNGEDPTAPTDPDYLTAYDIKRRGKFQTVKGQTVVNQFGTLTVDVKNPKSLLVPSAFSDEAPPSSPAGAFVNHFTCYDVDVTKRTPGFTAQTVTVQTPFETVDIQLRKPRQLCVPTNKNGEDPSAPTDRESLLCYDTKVKGKRLSSDAFVNNQFGPQTYRLNK